MISVIPSLASADQLRLGEQIAALGAGHALHLDIEDGNFVPNITFGMRTARAAAGTGCEADAHLMVTDPGEYLDELLEMGIRKIAVHAEASQYPAVWLNKIRAAGGRAGLAVNCMAPVEFLLPYIDILDYILIMTSEPDGGQQTFNSRMLDKIKAARRLFPERVSIMADGGITEELLPRVAAAGADTIILGRAVWGAADPAAQIKRLLKIANEGNRK